MRGSGSTDAKKPYIVVLSQVRIIMLVTMRPQLTRTYDLYGSPFIGCDCSKQDRLLRLGPDVRYSRALVHVFVWARGCTSYHLTALGGTFCESGTLREATCHTGQTHTAGA